MEREPLIVQVPSALGLVVDQVRRERRGSKKPRKERPCLAWEAAISLLLKMA